MSWNNWAYLGAGLGLGVGIPWLFKWLKVGVSSTAALSSSGENHKEILPFEPVKPTQNALLVQAQLAYQMASEMSQFKAGFLTRISHELRSPLNSLIGLQQLILSDLCDDPAEEREVVAQAQSAALKLVKLMDEILNVARAEHATDCTEIQPLQLKHVLEEVYDLTHLLAANNNFPLQVLPCDPEIYILADPRWLRQSLVNLVDTCISQMEEGSICVSAQPTSVAGSVHIWLDVQLPITAWTDPVDLIQSSAHVQPFESIKQPVRKNAVPSPGLKLMLNQTILEHIEGRLELLPVPTQARESACTRMQITIPLMIPETAAFE